MRIINKNIKILGNDTNILLSFIPSLWKLYWFTFKLKGLTTELNLNILFLGVQFRVLVYKELKRVTIQELIDMKNKNIKQKKILEGNKLIAEFMDLKFHPSAATILCYHLDWNQLMPVWVKFRDLEIDEEMFPDYDTLCIGIKYSMAHGTIEEFFEEVVKAVKWYNETIKNYQYTSTPKINYEVLNKDELDHLKYK